MTTRILLATALLAGACGKGPSEAECDQLLAHIVELEVAATGGAAGDKATLDAQRAKVAASVHKDFHGTCLKELPKAQVTCGLAAKTLEELSACDDG
jgi:hypothetical protein